MSSDNITNGDTLNPHYSADFDRKTSLAERQRVFKNTILFRSARDIRKKNSCLIIDKSWYNVSVGSTSDLRDNEDIAQVIKIDFIEQIMAGKYSLNIKNYSLLFNNQTLFYLFLGFQLKSGSPQELLFAMLTDFLRNSKVKKSRPFKDVRILACHIYSLFIHEQSPLLIAELSPFRERIVAEMNRNDYENKAKNLFNEAFEENLKTIGRQFSAFIDQKHEIYDKYLCRGSRFSLMDSFNDFYHVVGYHLESISTLFKLPNEFDPKESYEIGLVLAFQTLFYLDNIKNLPIATRIPYIYFLEKRRKSKIKKRSSTHKAHNFCDTSLIKPTNCGLCNRLIWGIPPQAMECFSCLITTHTYCANVDIPCPKRKAATSHTLRLPFRPMKNKDKKSSTEFENEKTKTVTSAYSSTLIKNKADTISLCDEDFSPTNSAEELVDSDLDYQPELPDPQSIYGVAEFKAMSTNRRKLHLVFNEFVHTERSHLRRLKIMNILFNKRLMEIENYRELSQLIFSRISDLIEYHSLLVKSLKQRNEDKVISDKFADSLAPLFNESVAGGYADACVGFCSDQKNVLDVLSRQLKSNVEFSTLISEFEKSKLLRNLKLSDLLLSQMQRLTRYPLLIDQIIKLSKSYPEEVDKLNQIKAFAKLYLDKVSEQAAISENRNFLRKITPIVDIKAEFNLIPPPYDSFSLGGKKLIYYGEAGIKINKKYNEVCLLLFETDLVILFKCDNGRLLLRSFIYKGAYTNSALSVSPVIELTKDLVIRPLAADKKCFLILHKQKLQLIEFHTSSDRSAKTWVKIITDSINEKLKLEEIRQNENTCVEMTEVKSESVCRLKKINSMYERTTILMAERGKEEGHVDVLVSLFNEILKNITLNTPLSPDYYCLSVDQLPNLQLIVQTLEIMRDGTREDADLKTLETMMECSDYVEDQIRVSSMNSCISNYETVLYPEVKVLESFDDTLKMVDEKEQEEVSVDDVRLEEVRSDVIEVTNDIVLVNSFQELSDSSSIISFDDNPSF